MAQEPLVAEAVALDVTTNSGKQLCGRDRRVASSTKREAWGGSVDWGPFARGQAF